MPTAPKPEYLDRRLYVAIFGISAATLLLELTLTRIFDVVLWTNMASFIVSSAIFGIGLAGIAIMLWPMPETPTSKLLAAASGGFAIAVLLLIPTLKLLPFDPGDVLEHPIRQVVYFSTLYLCLLSPFFAAGMVIATILTRQVQWVHRLYFWDLIGAGLGSLGIIWLPSLIGPAAILALVATVGAVVAAVISPPGTSVRPLTCAACIGLVGLTIGLVGRIDFPAHALKFWDPRRSALGGQVELSRWDPVAKIDILPQHEPFRRRIMYDGGSQASFFFQFDGDFDHTRAHYFELVDGQPRYNTGRYVALAYWLKRSTPM